MLNARGRPLIPALSLPIAAVLFATFARARAGNGIAGPYELAWSTIDGGGWTFSTGVAPRGRTYSLGSTARQPDAGASTGVAPGGSAYTLGGGFWGGGKQHEPIRTYLPLVLRSYRPFHIVLGADNIERHI